MDFVDTVFSFIPLLMIIFFFVRLAAAAKKRNTPKSPDSIRPAENRSSPPENKREGQKQGKMIQSRLESLLQDKFPKIVPPPVSAGAPAGDNKSSAAAKPVQKHRTPAAQTLNTLNNSREINTAAATGLQKENARLRVNSLPELKKAVVWAEILGKPKGLD